jgi:hypothetical protein
MKIVRENINFERTDNPHRNLDIGKRQLIEKWLEEIDLDEWGYLINNDLSVDILKDFNLVGYGLEQLPEYIQFNIIYGGFYGGGNPWQSLEGFPKEIQGDLQINSPSAPSGYMKKFTENEIRKIINVHGGVYIN